MTKTSLICGSLATDTIMQFPGRFGESLLADQLHKVNVSFLVPTMRTEFGGCSGNIAYSLKMLGGDPRIVGVMGQDSAAYLERLQKLGISTANILIKADSYNAQCFVTADADNNQINAFHPGAMSFAHENPIANAGPAKVAIISPDGDQGMLKHAADLAELGIPFMFDPGQQLPRFNGEQLIDFINKATYVSANDYEMEMLMERTGLTLPDIASRLDALIEALSVEQGELQTLKEHTFSYVSLLRNQSRSVQAWPSIELILNDANDKPLLRRVIAPRDYLPATIDVSQGFAPRSEQTIKLYFALDQLTASGYHIAIFYP
ncbi:PfkB family carbohydrate kinase [Janthinobacterium sp. 78]|uniref:PfkB family carbohydrate kinase n=1 Tax=Janthinobacterium sp. 78 TaxID=2135631 RepID=UPI000D5D51EC|nr:PfkB family carbohydrate kinase [Janthinobacterium sp. 78]PVX38349.1 adenosine kinase [Janthinobacterium sp. 78]